MIDEKHSIFRVAFHFALLFFIIIFLLSSQLIAADLIQRVEIPSSVNPVGSGARALGMGGAFIAVADDATAASWNPGGLIQLETPEVSVVGAFFYRTENNNFGLNPEASGSQSVSKTNLNYFSFAWPFALFKHNMIASINYQSLYDFSKSWNFNFNSVADDISIFRNVDFEQWGSLSAIGLAYCIQVTPALSLGATLNFWGDYLTENGWKKKTDERGTGEVNFGPGFTLNFTYTYFKKDIYSFEGINANFGLLWNATPRLTIGAVFKMPFTADIKFDTEILTRMSFPDFPGMDNVNSVRQSEDQELDMPMSYGIGFAWRFSDSLTASLDIYRTQWDDFTLIDSLGNKTNPITGGSSDTSSLDPTHQIRVGAEYLIIGNKYVVPLRGGIFYDPAPAEKSIDDFYGVTIGSGLAYKRFIFDAAYQYRFGKDVGKSYLEHLDFSQDVGEHTLYSSVIVHLE